MDTQKLYRSLAVVAGLIGAGMILGHSLGNGTTNTPVWIGGLLILGGAVLFGMSISSPKDNQSSGKPDTE